MGVVVELTNEEWSLVEHLFDPPVHRGVKGTIPRRDIVSAILWVARTGCRCSYVKQPPAPVPPMLEQPRPHVTVGRRHH